MANWSKVTKAVSVFTRLVSYAPSYTRVFKETIGLFTVIGDVRDVQIATQQTRLLSEGALVLQTPEIWTKVPRA